jgi:site-specific DNA recombinase
VIATHVHQIVVMRTEIAISLLRDHSADDGEGSPLLLTVPWSKPAHRRHRDFIVPEGSGEIRPIRADTRAKLVTAIARGRRWLSEIEAGAATIDDIADREACSKRHGEDGSARDTQQRAGGARAISGAARPPEPVARRRRLGGRW